MKKRNSYIFLFALFCLLSGIAGGIFIYLKRGIPFVTEREQWTIGVYRGRTPFSFNNAFNWLNPVLKAEHVKDISAKFVADPFLIKEDATWYLFFEVYNNDSKQGDLAVATSSNTWVWNYGQVILDEPFHLSYPYVFRWENMYYLIPESSDVASIRLYRADDFPKKWSFVKVIIDGGDYVDNSIANYNGKWWLFSSVPSNDNLHLFYSDDLLGPWVEHPKSPIVEGNNHVARPSGRVLIYEDRLYRYTMDVNPPFGTHQILAFEITDITPTSYSEKLVSDDPILKASGSGWNAQAMHQIDPVQVGPDLWVAAVDGFGKYPVFGWDY